KAKKGVGQGGHNWWPRFRAGEPLLKRQIDKIKRVYKLCQKCKRKPWQEVHHINMDHTDHGWDNLMPVCRSCHRLFHSHQNNPHKGRPPRTAHVVSISDPRIEDTYDVAMPPPWHNFVANDFVVHNSFNRSHSVAYGVVSYWSLWLKAHYPVEFAAATLDAEKEPARQIDMLRELAEEGVGYVPVDAERSAERWEVGTREGK